jgi:hypothetical protein
LDAFVDLVSQSADLDSLRGDWMTAILGVTENFHETQLPDLNLDGQDRDFFDAGESEQLLIFRNESFY